MSLTARERGRLVDNLVDELNGAALYDALAVAEKDERLAEVYRRLAIVERRHAERWRKKLEDAGETLPDFKPSWRTRTLAFLAGRFGTRIVLPSVQVWNPAPPPSASHPANRPVVKYVTT